MVNDGGEGRYDISNMPSVYEVIGLIILICEPSDLTAVITFSGQCLKSALGSNKRGEKGHYSLAKHSIDMQSERPGTGGRITFQSGK